MTLQKLLGRCSLSVAASCILASGCVTTTSLRPDFDDALQQHLAAIQSRNMPAFIDTLTKGENLKVIFPNGHILESTKAVIEFHREWFADKQWVFEPEVVNIIEHSNTVTALLRYDYRDEESGPPRSSWLVLVFALEENAWRLVHDQNTRIE